MNVYEDPKEFRRRVDTQWATAVIADAEEGETEISFSVKNGQVRVVKDGRVLFTRRNRSDDYRNYSYTDHSEESTYRFQIAGFGQDECRVKDIRVETDSEVEESTEE